MKNPVVQIFLKSLPECFQFHFCGGMDNCQLFCSYNLAPGGFEGKLRIRKRPREVMK